MGLRERNKALNRQAIVESARGLLVDRGYQSTTMEDVAADAGVSVGTLYNYFASKQALLAGVFEAEIEAMLAAGQKVLDFPPDGASEGVKALLGLYVEDLLGIPRELLRELLLSGMAEGGIAGERGTVGVGLMGQHASLVSAYHERGEAGTTVDVDDVVFVTYSLLLANLLIYLSNPEIKAAAVRRQISRQVDAVFGGLGTATNKEK